MSDQSPRVRLMAAVGKAIGELEADGVVTAGPNGHLWRSVLAERVAVAILGPDGPQGKFREERLAQPIELPSTFWLDNLMAWVLRRPVPKVLVTLTFGTFVSGPHVQIEMKDATFDAREA